MARILQTCGAVFVGFLLFIGLLHGVLIAKGRHSAEAMGAFHDWPVIGGFFPKAVSEEVAASPDERREKESSAWLADARNEFKLPPPFTAEEVETLVRELKDARSQADSARTRYEAERADLERQKKEVDENRAALHKAAEEVDRQVKSFKSESDELDRRRTFVSREEIKNFKTLAQIYESMPAEDAAQKLDSLDEDVAAKLIGQMSERKAGRVLAAMKTPRAVLITKRLQALMPPEKADASPASSSSR